VNLHHQIFQNNRAELPYQVFRARLIFMAGIFVVAFVIVSVRLADFGLWAVDQDLSVRIKTPKVMQSRPNIVDRNGKLLATDIQTASLFADPRKVNDIDEAAELLVPILKDMSAVDLRKILAKQKRSFVWVKRELSPRQESAIHNLGIAGLGFVRENRRVYPTGSAAAHILGHVDLDNKGIAGIEKYIDRSVKANTVGGPAPEHKPVELAVDLRVQHGLRDELVGAVKQYQAKAAAGVILDVATGEVVAMSSLPDYNPNKPKTALDKTRINRMVAGVYELGSTFKVITIAMALDMGVANMSTKFDAREPLRYGKFTISDFHAQKRFLSVPEIFVHSSNIGSARMAMAVGIGRHKAFLKSLGLLDRLSTELPENARPLYPKNWKELNTMTIAFGHGLSVAPLQLAAAGAALVNGGLYIPPTFLKRDPIDAIQLARRVVKRKTSAQIREMMALNVNEGTAKRAHVPGMRVGGKTGTAEKVVNGRYSKSALLTSFLGIFPTDAPRYVVLIMLDEPKPSEATRGFATSGWNAVPLAGKVIKRVAPLLGILPKPVKSALVKTP